jgi:hypothetical protein
MPIDRAAARAAAEAVDEDPDHPSLDLFLEEIQG